MGRNGVLQPKMAWGIDEVHLTPVESSKWIRPTSGNTYYLTWQARLDKAAAAERVDLNFTSALPNQEAVIEDRAFYDGVFNVKGTIGGKTVKGYAVAENQLPGQGF